MMQPGWEWARNEVNKRIERTKEMNLLPNLRNRLRKAKEPKRIEYKRTWTRGEGADPQLFITVETTCLPNQPLDDTSLIELMIYLKRNGWTQLNSVS
jgi:hypothetical protein